MYPTVDPRSLGSFLRSFATREQKATRHLSRRTAYIHTAEPPTPRRLRPLDMLARLPRRFSLSRPGHFILRLYFRLSFSFSRFSFPLSPRASEFPHFTRSPHIPESPAVLGNSRLRRTWDHLPLISSLASSSFASLSACVCAREKRPSSISLPFPRVFSQLSLSPRDLAPL